MNLLNKIIYVLLFISLSDIAIAQECKATLQIKCDIQNANFFINDSLVGQGNFAETGLTKGTYKITVLENSDRWDAQKFIDTIKITKCNIIKLRYNFIKKVYLDSEPQDASVFSGDSLVGYTPLLIPLKSGSIKLEKPGYESLSFKDIGSINKPVKLKFIGTKPGEQFFDKTLFKILLSSMVALGGVTAFFKLKADDRFDEYQSTGNTDLLDQTHKFDTISGVTFVAMQLNFGLMIYLFLVD